VLLPEHQQGTIIGSSPAVCIMSAACHLPAISHSMLETGPYRVSCLPSPCHMSFYAVSGSLLHHPRVMLPVPIHAACAELKR
jgi:hypothetical protein